MICLACHVPVRGRLCSACAATLRPAPERILDGRLRVVAPFLHEGAARRLVHLLKYRGLVEYAGLAADLLAPRVPNLPLVPVPRSLSRRVRYGIDPARTLAGALSRRVSVPVLPILAPHIHTARRAGRDHRHPVPQFRLRHPPPDQVVLVDDVVTTGATVMAAALAIGLDRVRMVVAANSAGTVSSLSVPFGRQPAR